MTTLATLQINSITGLPLTVIHLPPGTWAAYPAAKSDQRQIEFYDTRYNHTIFGQFTGGRYNVTDFVQPGRDDRYGLALNGMERDWTISAATVRQIKEWLA